MNKNALSNLKVLFEIFSTKNTKRTCNNYLLFLRNNNKTLAQNIQKFSRIFFNKNYFSILNFISLFLFSLQFLLKLSHRVFRIAKKKEISLIEKSEQPIYM